MEKELSSEESKEESIELGFEPAYQSIPLLVNITLFISAIKAYYQSVSARNRKQEIQRILDANFHVHYTDKKTGRRVLSELTRIEHEHELRTAICLAQMNYDVVFAPAMMFRRGEKKFDIYLLRDTVILTADLKCISGKHYLTLASRIKEGTEQAPRIVVDIISDMDTKTLIQGLRYGVYKNNLLKEILLIYKKRFYRLPKSLIVSDRIFDILKNEKGYT